MSLCNYKKRIKKFGTPELIKRFSSTVSHKRILIKFILSEVILTLLVIMLARPQVGNRIASKKKQERDRNYHCFRHQQFDVGTRRSSFAIGKK